MDLASLDAKLINASIRQLTNGNDNDPITKLRLLCLSRGATGINGLSRAFRNIDNDGSKALNREEFIAGIREFGLKVNDGELNQMFDSFDTDNNGSITMTEFLMKLRPEMPQSRLDIIMEAFNKMDATHDGVITVEDLKNVYSVKEHPKFQNGEKTEDEILTEFLQNFEGSQGNHDGKITKEEFTNYYAGISASIDNDEHFILMMRRAFAM